MQSPLTEQSYNEMFLPNATGLWNVYQKTSPLFLTVISDILSLKSHEPITHPTAIQSSLQYQVDAP